MKLVRWGLRYWGYLLILVGIWGIIQDTLPLEVLVVVSALAATYFSCQVPVRCGAPKRDGQMCRNNARGVLLGCNQVRMHKTLKLQMLVSRSQWAQFGKTMWNGTQTACASVVNIATVLSTMVGVVTLVVTSS